MVDAQAKIQRLDWTTFAIRPLTVEDRPAVEAIADQIWEGNDYLPAVFDRWLADEDGLFCAGVLHDQGRRTVLRKSGQNLDQRVDTAGRRAKQNETAVKANVATL